MPSLAVVEPQFAINVGYVARAMANFALPNLYIVSGTKPAIDWDEASKFASHGERLIGSMQLVPSISSLHDRYPILIGTTAIRARKKSNVSRTTLDFETFLPTLSRTMGFNRRTKPNAFAKACFVFGRDTTGLTNDELRQCDYVVTITTGSSYQTLNISHAVAIVLYGLKNYLWNSAGSFSKSQDIPKHRQEHEMIVKLFLDLAELSDFQSHKRQKLSETLSRLINRGNPTLRETYLLLGLASKARSRIQQLEKNQVVS
jgi:TrmH family RNA methyltransferase